jgi:hypothetical protein
VYDGKPICAIWAFDLPAEAKDESERERLDVFTRDRDCTQHTTWQHGFTPKEHIEMNLLQQQKELEDHRREQEQAWQRQRDEDDRQWREKQASQEHEWRKEDTRRADQLEANNATWQNKVRRDTWVLCMITGAIAILAGIVSGPIMDWLKPMLFSGKSSSGP